MISELKPQGAVQFSLSGSKVSQKLVVTEATRPNGLPTTRKRHCTGPNSAPENCLPTGMHLRPRETQNFQLHPNCFQPDTVTSE